MKTELDIVNSMLISINNAPVQSLENNISPDVYNARSTLNDVRTSILSKGWFSNLDVITLLPGNDKQCVLPSNILKATPLTRGVVDRGGRLYDNKNTTYEFELPQKVRILIDLPLEDMPIELLDYVVAEAAYRFYRTYGGDADMTQYYYNDVVEKRGVALSADLRDRKLNGSAFTRIGIRYGEV